MSEEITPTIEAEKKNTLSFFEKAPFYIFLALVFLLPIFFLPNVSVQFSKGLLLAALIVLTFILFIAVKLKEGTISFPKHVFSIVAVFIPATFFLSSFFSKSISSSVIGLGFEIGTAVSILLMFILLYLTSQLLATKSRIFSFYLAFFASFFILVFFQVARLVMGPGFLSFGVFTDPVSNLIGKWNEIGLFFGLTTILSLITIEAFIENRLFKFFGILILIISLFFLILVNFSSVFVLVGLFSLSSLIYMLAFSKNPFQGEMAEPNTGQQTIPKRKLSIASLIVFVISIIFIFAGAQINDHVARKFNISHIEVRPSWQSTFLLSKKVLKSHPFFGVGPNRFVNQWLAYKPEGVNNTPFWNTDFTYGVGLIPTFFITTGLLGIVAWIVFFLLFLWIGFKAIFYPIQDALSRYVILTSFFGAMYLWVYHIFYVPSLVTFAFSFLFTGVFLAALVEMKFLEAKTIRYTLDPRKNFISVFVLIVCLVGSVALGFLVGQKLMSAFYIEKGMEALNKNSNAIAAENHILRAVRINGTDDHYRILSQFYIYTMNLILNEKDSSPEILRSRFEAVLPKAIENAKIAISKEPTDYQNHLTLGAVYELVLTVGYKDAYEPAKESYVKALELNPHSPAILLLEARLEAVNNNLPKAKDLVIESLKMKNNYTEGIYLLSQIEIKQNNIKGAIDAVSAVTYLNPDDPVAFFQLGFLKYSDKNYAGAKEALEKAIALNSTYSNARYFLGLSYHILGDSKGAITQFVEIQKLNPDNKEVELILGNLRSGRGPFVNAVPPVDDKPEKRKQLPVSESQ